MKDSWTEIISPKRSLLDINLKELWRYRDLIMLFVRRDFVSQYKQTILGPIWLFIQPLFTTLTFFFVFNQIAKIPTDNIDPILFYLSGITLWNYFSDCFNKTSNTFVANAGIFGKVYFPRLATPISIVISNLIKLGIQVLLFLAIMVYQIFTKDIQVNVNMHILILPYLILLMAVMGLGLGIIFSALTTKYRDLSFLLTFGIQLRNAHHLPLELHRRKITYDYQYEPTYAHYGKFPLCLFQHRIFRLERLSIHQHF
jgi:lipopolysaccharide transport system permease protein